MLGEDENLAKNRLALLCQSCRLVNGQAPPGIKTLEELGKWRCSNCGAWNGVDNDRSKTMQQKTDAASPKTPTSTYDPEMVEKRTHSGDEHEEKVAKLEEDEGTTGAEHTESGPGSVTKRVTRSAGEPEYNGL